MIKQAIERNRLSFKSLTITEVADWIKEVSTQETSVSLSGYPCIGIQKRTWRLLPKTNNVFLVNLLKKTFPDSLKRVISRLCLKKILWFLKNSLTNMSHMTCRSFFFFSTETANRWKYLGTSVIHLFSGQQIVSCEKGTRIARQKYYN